MLPSRKKLTLPLIFALSSIAACDSGYNKIYDDDTNDDDDGEVTSNAPSCISASDSAGLTVQAQALLTLISDLSCDAPAVEDRYIAGQSLGNGNEITEDNNVLRGYETLIEKVNTETNRRIAIASVEYSGNAKHSREDLLEANIKLEEHTNLTGIASVTWTPLNPWGNDTDNIDLDDLYEENNSSEAKESFDARLDVILDALSDLNDKNIPVLFAPFTEMNRVNIDSIWYGPSNDESTDGDFGRLWDYVYEKAQEKELNNVIWVYAPTSSINQTTASPTWGTPDSSQYDIVAPITYSAELNIEDYEEYLELNKPMGMTRLAHTGNRDGGFDNNLYITRLTEKYPHIAYWIADHDYDGGDLRSISRNTNAEELLDNQRILTTARLLDGEWLEPSTTDPATDSTTDTTQPDTTPDTAPEAEALGS